MPSPTRHHRFVHSRDEAAFAALVRRHGPMVFGVCRRTLRNPHAAHGAFHSFLSLARKVRAQPPGAGQRVFELRCHLAVPVDRLDDSDYQLLQRRRVRTE